MDNPDSRGNYTLGINYLEEDEFEENDNELSAYPLTIDNSYSAVSFDEDWYSIFFAEGENFSFSLSGNYLRTTLIGPDASVLYNGSGYINHYCIDTQAGNYLIQVKNTTNRAALYSFSFHGLVDDYYEDNAAGQNDEASTSTEMSFNSYWGFIVMM